MVASFASIYYSNGSLFSILNINTIAMVAIKMVLMECQKQGVVEGLDFNFTFASGCMGLKKRSKLLCQ